MGRLKRQIPTLVVETFSVVLAVLLALAANQCREEHKEDKLAAEVLEAVKREMKANLGRVEVSLEKNRVQLEALKATGEPTESLVIHVPSLSLQETAWQTIVMTGTARLLDFDVASQLSSVYHLQSVTHTTWEGIFELMTSGDIFEGKEEARSVRRRLRTRLAFLVGLEEKLLEQYQAFLHDTGAVEDTVPAP